MQIVFLFFKLLIGHALCDYPLQGDFLSKGKNHKNPIPGVPWYWCLSAHALIHAGMVWFLTGFWFLGLVEFLYHGVIDYMKYNGNFGFSVDQSLHIACKVIWCLIVLLIFKIG